MIMEEKLEKQSKNDEILAENDKNSVADNKKTNNDIVQDNELPDEKSLKFKNTTKLNEQAITAFQIFAMKKYTWTIASLISIVFGGLGLGLCFVNAYVGVAVLIAGILGGVIFFPYLSREQIKKQNALIKKKKKYVNVFEFFDEKLVVTNVDGENDIYQIYDYKGLAQVVLFAEYIAIYINKNQSYLLDKKGMNKGTIDEVLALLKSQNIPFKDKTTLGEVKKK